MGWGSLVPRCSVPWVGVASFPGAQYRVPGNEARVGEVKGILRIRHHSCMCKAAAIDKGARKWRNKAS